MSNIHTSNYKPVLFPVNGDNVKSNIDRLQDLSFSVATNRDKIKEIGRSGAVGYKKNIPTISGNLRQLEYGSMAFWNQLANKASSNTSIDLDDFKTSMVDIIGYETDDDDNFIASVWYPKLRVSGFNLNIGDPMANAERSFTLAGEDEITWQNNNKYVITFVHSSSTTGAESIVIGSGALSSYPDPVQDPDDTGTYILRIVRVRSGVSTELVVGTDFTYTSGTKTIAVTSVSGDKYKVIYTAATYITGVEPFTANDSDLVCLPAENCSIYLATSTYIHELQSVAIDVSFERSDLKEIGNSEVVSRGIKSKTVNVTLGRTLANYTIDEILRGKAGASWGKIDPREFADDIKLIVKMFDSKDKTNFLLGYSIDNLATSSLDASAPLDDYNQRSTQLTGEEMVITDSESSL